MLDLHMHSILSDDGEFTPSALAEMAHARGLKAIALTDHNVVRGHAELTSRCAALGMEAIAGIEIDCTFRGLDVHVLGLFIDPGTPGWAALEQNVLDQELAALDQKVANLQALGLPLDLPEARRRAAQPIVSAEIFAEVLLDDPALKKHPRLAPYRPGGSRSDMPLVHFYWDYFAQGKPAHVPLHFPSFEEALAQVRRSGGVPVLAHPGHTLRGRLDWIRPMQDLGLAGLEVFSTYHTQGDTELLLAAARELGLLMTPGSDFHGRNKPAIALGGHGCTLEPTDLLERLRAAR